METTRAKVNEHLQAIKNLLDADPEYRKSLEINDDRVPKSLKESVGSCTIIILPSGTVLEQCPPG